MVGSYGDSQTKAEFCTSQESSSASFPPTVKLAYGG